MFAKHQTSTGHKQSQQNLETDFILCNLGQPTDFLGIEIDWINKKSFPFKQKNLMLRL